MEQFLYFLHKPFLLCLLIFLSLLFLSPFSPLPFSAPPNPSLIFIMVAEMEMDVESEPESEQVAE